MNMSNFTHPHPHFANGVQVKVMNMSNIVAVHNTAIDMVFILWYNNNMMIPFFTPFSKSNTHVQHLAVCSCMNITTLYDVQHMNIRNMNTTHATQHEDTISKKEGEMVHLSDEANANMVCAHAIGCPMSTDCGHARVHPRYNAFDMRVVDGSRTPCSSHAGKCNGKCVEVSDEERVWSISVAFQMAHEEESIRVNGIDVRTLDAVAPPTLLKPASPTPPAPEMVKCGFYSADRIGCRACIHGVEHHEMYTGNGFCTRLIHCLHADVDVCCVSTALTPADYRTTTRATNDEVRTRTPKSNKPIVLVNEF